MSDVYTITALKKRDYVTEVSEEMKPALSLPVFNNNRVVLPQNLLSSPGILRQDFESLTGWGVTNGTQELDTTYFKTGTKGIRVTANAGAQGRIQLDLGASSASQYDFSNTDQFRIWFYVHDYTKLNGYITLLFYDPTGVKSAYHGIWPYANGWHMIVINKADFTLAGGFTWSEKVRYIRCYFTALSGQVGVITWDSFYSDTVSKPAVCITFDDGVINQYTLAYLQALKPHNIPATLYMTTSNIGAGGCPTAAQLLTMQADGWCIANHTRSHTNMQSANYATALAAVQNGDTDLAAIGITSPGRLHLAYPGGAFDDDAIQAAIDGGMRTARTTDGITTPEHQDQMFLPWPRPCKMAIKIQWDNTKVLSDLTTAVDWAVTNKCIVTFLFHNVVASSPSTWEITTATLTDFCEYLGSLRLPCITMDEAYRLQSGPVQARVAR